MGVSAAARGSRACRLGVRLLAVAIVTLVGVGACALEPRRDSAGRAEPGPIGVSAPESGASATPAPDRTTTAPEPAKPTTPQTATPKPKTTVQDCPQGEHQRDVERHLNDLGGFGDLVVDGKQSKADCAAIKKFQRRYGISPPLGRAGPTTADVARRLARTDPSDCGAGDGGTTICVDLTRQTTYAVRDGRVVWGPTVVRTGMRGYTTDTGTFAINARSLREWSNPYQVWLPYWQHFTSGMGFHETTTYLHNKSIGSHGCVNLLHQDAKALWDFARYNMRVKVFGQRPGT